MPVRSKIATRLPVSLDSAASGPPSTGFHPLGEVYVDGQGVEWVNVRSGTPGNWICASGGATIDYVESFTTVSTTATTLATAIEVGLQIAPYNTGGDPIVIEAQAPLTNGTAVSGAQAALSICDVSPGNASPSTANEVLRLLMQGNVVGTLTCKGSRRFTPAAGIRVYRAYLWATGGITATMTSNLAAQSIPAFLWARWG